MTQPRRHPTSRLPPSTKVKTPFQFCLSCCWTLGCWSVWLVLGALLGLQLYAALSHELPVPEFLLRRIETEFGRANLAVSFRHAQFDPTGRLLFHDLRVGPREFADPLFTARSVYIRKSLWSLLAGHPLPDELRVDGASLHLPAFASPSGTAEPLVRDLAAALRFENRSLRVDQLAGRAGPLAFTVRGEVRLPPQHSARRPDLVALTRTLLHQGPSALLWLDRLTAVEQPALHVTLSVNPLSGHTADVSFTAAALHRPLGQPVHTGPLCAHTTLFLRDTGPQAVRLAFDVAQPAYTGNPAVASGRSNGEVFVRLAPGSWRPAALEAQFAFDRVALFDETVLHPLGRATWAEGEPWRLALGLSLEDSLLALGAEADPARRTAQVRLDGFVPPGPITRALARHAPKKERFFRFLDPVELHATARFGDGFRFEEVQALARVGRMDSGGVAVTGAHGRIQLDSRLRFSATEAYAAIGPYFARGSYDDNFKTKDYRFLLTGELQPMAIRGWLPGAWWAALWDDFRFNGPAPAADVDVQGRWQDDTRSTYFGATDATELVALGADFEQAHALVYSHPGFAHAYNLRVARAGGAQRARGSFARHSVPGNSRALLALDYDLAGNLDVPTARHLGGATVDEIAGPFHFGQPPEVVFRGRMSYREGRASPDLSFTGRASGGLTYYGLPLESIAAEGTARGDRVDLDPIRFTLAGGAGGGKALLTGEGEARRLSFDLALDQADLVGSIRALQAYEAANSGAPPTPPSAAERELMKRAAGGHLKVALSAAGSPATLASFRGDGHLQVTDAALGEVRLFGLLSQVLSAFALRFSTLKLDTMQGNFHLDDARMTFPNLRVTGPTSLIEAQGDYQLEERQFNFTAHFKPYEQGRNIFTGVLGLVMNPLSGIFELKLTGPLDDPKWTVSFGPRAPRPMVTPATPVSEAPGLPPAPPAPPEAPRPPGGR